MSEVEKMYRNAGVERKEYGYCSWDCDCPYTDCEDIHCDGTCPYWEIERIDYPPFTAEKQLELIKFLCTKRYIDITFTPEKEYYIFAYFVGCGFDKNFDEALAMFVNQYWNELSEEERKQVKGILE